MLRHLPLAVLAMILASPPVKAEDYCERTCAGNKFKEADRQMNARYSQLITRLNPEERTAVRKAQKAWETYRDNMCLFEAMGLGSVRSMVLSGCLTRLTEEHIKILDYHLTCEEGDLSCKTWPSNSARK